MRKSAQLDVMVVPQTISFCYKILQKCILAQIKCCPDQLVLHTYLYMYYECIYMTLHIFFFISCFILDYIYQPLDSFILRKKKEIWSICVFLIHINVYRYLHAIVNMDLKFKVFYRTLFITHCEYSPSSCIWIC